MRTIAALLALAALASAVTFPSNRRKLTFELDGCRTRGGGNCVEGRTIGSYYQGEGAIFSDTRNVATGYSSSGGPPHGFSACNGPHSGWGNKPMSVKFVLPGTSRDATIQMFGACRR